jgi:hypothetical protein
MREMDLDIKYRNKLYYNNKDYREYKEDLKESYR